MSINLIEYTRRHSNQHRELVYHVLLEMGKATPHQIKNRIDELARVTANDKYEKGLISSNDVEKVLRNNTIDIRTIHRKLNELIMRGSISRQNGTYFPSSNSIDIRDFGAIFGEGLLKVMLDGQQFGVPIEERIIKFVEFFGAYVLYAFLEAAYPVFPSWMTHMSNEEKDQFTMNWIRGALPTELMYRYFLLYSEPNKRFDGTDTYCTLSPQVVRKMTKIFRERCPQFYQRIEEYKHRFMYTSKSGFVQSFDPNSDSVPFIDYKTEDM